MKKKKLIRRIKFLEIRVLKLEKVTPTLHESGTSARQFENYLAFKKGCPEERDFARGASVTQMVARYGPIGNWGRED
jgi:hypothetical protein|tara:strand:- start:276 stop:506 length:231 start_codon:yes stop_codon:yes gene_type:complete